MKDHHARGSEETVHDLLSMVSAGPADREPTTRLRQARVPDITATEDAGELAPPKPGLRDRLSD
jgi:hypothetical protein